MREYEKTASRVGLLVAVVALVVQVIANEIDSVGDMGLAAKLIIAVAVGSISFLIMEWLPKLLLKERLLCGLYMITYNNNRNNLCSIVNIENNHQRDRYSIDIYDCYLQDSCWLSVENQYPLNLDNVFYDLSPRGLHLVSNSDNYKTCIFIRFTYETNSGNVMRYGSQKPFNRPYSGRFEKLSSKQLCEVFNSEFNNDGFCNMLLSEHVRCKSQGRAYCQQKESVILDKVRKDGHYLEIAKMLYDSVVNSADPCGMPKSKKTRPKVKPETVPVNKGDEKM